MEKIGTAILNSVSQKAIYIEQHSEKNLNDRCLLKIGNAITEGVLSGRCAKEEKMCSLV